MSRAQAHAVEKPAKILVADDDDGVRAGLVANLELEGYQVSEARDGAEAIQMLSATNYDLILSDVVMPSATGMEVLSAARRRQSDTPFILISGFVSDELVTRALAQGLFAMLYKPLAMDLILEVVARALRRSPVLLVFDEGSPLASLAPALRSASVRVETCPDGPSALSYARRHAVDVCVLDVTAAPVAGFETCQALRAADAALDVIAVSAAAEREPLRLSAPEGVATLRQPFAARELLTTIAHLRATSTASK